MGLVTTPATILKTYAYSETSKILRLLTRDLGLCSVIAKGAQRPKSRFAGVLEPFTDGVATFYTKEGRELHTLSGFELSRERQALGRELVRYGAAGLLTELAFRCAPSAPDRRLFRQLRQGLDRMVATTGDLEAALLEEAWSMIACLGFSPNVERCGVCDQVPEHGTRVKFDVAAGGVRCDGCREKGGTVRLRTLEPEAWVELGRLVGGRRDVEMLETGEIQRTILRDFVAYHLAENRPLNSFRFLEEHLT